MSLFDPPSAGHFPEPRDFQIAAHEKLRDGIRRGHRRQLLVASTGSGKTFIGLRIISEALQKGRRGLFVCDRTALINQTSLRSDEYGLTNHAIVQANHPRRDNSLPFQIASIQTIQARGYWPQADVIVIDEAHTQYAATRELLQKSDAAIIGLTATPCSKGLGLYYTNMVNASTMHELTVSGVLVPMKILTCVKPDMTGANTSSGEWTAKDAGEREAQIIGDVLGEWVAHGENRKTIAFGADIAYCISLAQRFNEAGIRAETFTCETSDSERQELLNEFNKPDSNIRLLVSIEALSKGFDVPDIGCVIDARPLRKSLSTAIQMWGRGLRSSPGKLDCLLLDFSGNIQRFYDDFVDIYFNGFKSLDVSEKMDATVREEAEYTPSGCPECGYKPFRRQCLSCGFQKVSEVIEDSTSGVMQEIRIGKKVLATDKYDLYKQLCAYARSYVNSQKRSGWVWHKFRELTGEKAPNEWNFEQTPDAVLTAATMGKLKSMRIAYHKARGRTV